MEAQNRSTSVKSKSKTMTPKAHLVKRIQMMIGLLILQFILGMALNTIGTPGSSTRQNMNVLWHTLLGLHIANGVILLLNAGYILYYTTRYYRQLQRAAVITFLGIAAAIVFGSLTVRNIHSELMSFFMAMAFLVAISVYGNSLHERQH